VAAIRAIYAADSATLRQLTDAVYWPQIPRDQRPGSGQVAADSVGAGPASTSDYASLLRTHCGEQVVGHSWWAAVCPGGSYIACRARSPALLIHWYFVRRGGRLMLWFAYP